MIAKTKPTAAPEFVRGIKGFSADLSCRGFKFEVGKTYTHTGDVKACKGGFHAVTGHPLAVLQYYAPAGSRFCIVEQGGAMHSDDGTKTAAEILKVGREIGISDLVAEAVKWVTDRATLGERATGNRGAASATGNQGAASATGYQGAASATGYQGAASATGNHGAASATGFQGAASATGNHGAASATGNHGAASATGNQGAATASGYDGRVMGAANNALFAVERDDNYNIISVACGIVGKDGIKPNVWYVAKAGKLVTA